MVSIQSTEPKSQKQLTDDYLDSLKGAWYGWPESDCEEVQNLEALKAQLFVRDSHRALKQELDRPADRMDIERMKLLLHDAMTGEQRLYGFIIGHFSEDPLYAIPTHEFAAKAKLVFGTVELAEMIFSYLDANEILVAAQVNRTFADTISASIQLQKQLYQKGDPEAFWNSLFDSHSDGIACTSPFFKSREDAEPTLIVRINAIQESPGKFTLPKLPPRKLSMLVCQPPVTKLVGRPECDHRRFTTQDFERKPVVLKSSNGITMADLLEAAEKVSRRHRCCPFAQPTQHDENGETHMDVRFEGFVHLNRDDPLLHEISFFKKPKVSSAAQVRCRKNMVSLAPETELDKYMTAKRQALIGGLPIPSLGEWRSSLPSQQDDKLDDGIGTVGQLKGKARAMP